MKLTNENKEIVFTGLDMMENKAHYSITEPEQETINDEIYIADLWELLKQKTNKTILVFINDLVLQKLSKEYIEYKLI